MSENQTIKLKDGRTLGFAEYGDPKGVPFLSLHGWQSSRIHGRRMAEAATKLKIRIIAPDRPGTGLSSPKKNRTILDYADDLLELADHLKINKFTMMGISGGAPYAAAFAYKYPERLKKLALIVALAPTFIKGNLTGMKIKYKFLWWPQHYLSLGGNLTSFTNSMVTRHLSPERYVYFATAKSERIIAQKFKQVSIDTRKQAYLQGFRGPASDLNLYTHDWGFDLNKIDVPTFLYYGELDQVCPPVMGKYYESQIENSKLTIYKGESHYCQIEHTEDILKELIK